MVASSFEHLKVCHRLSFLPSHPILPADPVAGLGRPFSEITNTSAYRQLYCATVIFKIAVDKKVINFFNLSFLKLLFKCLMPGFGLGQEKHPGSFSVNAVNYARSLYHNTTRQFHWLSDIFRFWKLIGKPF